MALRPSSIPQRVPLPAVSHLLATAVTDPSFESPAASALVAELLDFDAACRLDYATTLVAESASASPPSVGGECALGTDVLEDRHEDFECLAAAVPRFASMLLAPEGDPDALDIPTPRSYAEAITGPYSSQRQAAMDAEMASWKSTGTYIDEVPPPGANIVDGMWIFRMTTLRVLLHVAAQRDYELHSLDFSTTFLQGSLQEEIWLRRPPSFTGSFPPGTQWSLRRPVYGLCQAPREWHDTLRTTLAALGFVPSTADPSLFLHTDISLPPFYVLVYVDDLVFATADTDALTLVKSELQKRHTCTDLGELRNYLGLQITRDRARRTITLTQSHMVHQVLQRFGFRYSSPQSTPLPTGHSLSAPPSNESIEPSGPYPELVGCLMYQMICTRPDLANPLSIVARYVAPRRHRPEHWEAAKRVLRYLCSTLGMGLVLGGRGPVVFTRHVDASWVSALLVFPTPLLFERTSHVAAFPASRHRFGVSAFAQLPQALVSHAFETRWLIPLNPPQPAPIRATVHSESPLRPCLRVFEGINGVATISSLKSQSGKDSVSYSLVISGTASPPTHSSLVVGNPCNPLMSPKHFLTMNGTWVAWSYKNQPAWMLQGRVTTPALVRAVLSYGRSYGGDLSDLRVAFFGNQTLVGRMNFVGVSSVAAVVLSTPIPQPLVRFGVRPAVPSEVPDARGRRYLESGQYTAGRQGRPLGQRLRGAEEAF
ncbi:unnamed protein product [Closterium sp. NIES-54]